MIEQLESNQWKFLYETYLYEEFLIPALAGRNINCNRQDDSSIYRVKTQTEIETRLNQSHSKSQAEENSR